MLPDYPEIKRRIIIHFNDSLNKEIHNDQFIGMFQNKPVYEGNLLDTTTIDGYYESNEYRSIYTEFRITPEDIIEKGLNAYRSKIPDIARELKEKKAKILIEVIEKNTSRIGNNVSCKSKIFIESYLEAIDKVYIDFDNFGNPVMPTLFIGSEGYEKNIDDYSKLESDPEIKEKLRKIIERKRREWIDRESNRKLVD